MTTDNNEVSTEVTEEVKQRSVSELLQLDTYQGMTDAEIQSIIDYYKEDSYNQGWQAGNTSAVLTELESAKEQSAKAYETAEAAFNMAINSVVKLESVDNG